MPYLLPKPRGTMGWLSSQVFYGIDCSDANPENWTEFGSYVSQATADAEPSAAAAAPTRARGKPETQPEQ